MTKTAAHSIGATAQVPAADLLPCGHVRHADKMKSDASGHKMQGKAAKGSQAAVRASE